MNLSKHFHSLIILGATLMATSCSVPKDITYMQGFQNEATQAVREARRILVQSDDKLSIIVTSNEPKLAEVFNLSVAQNRIGYSNYNTVREYTSSFTVDSEGNIDYPLIGKIHIAGLNRHEVAEKIQKEILGRGYLKDAIVSVEFLNATIAVLGDVEQPGEYPIDKDNLTILQAISKAGDLRITGQRNNVLVVREENGQDRAYRLDLTDTKSLLESPAYYLRQNDVVYIEPNSTAKRGATSSGNTFQSPSFWISVASLLTTISAVCIR